MKTLMLLMLFFIPTYTAFCQDNTQQLIKDLDGDAIKDTVLLDTKNWQIIVRLSSRPFISIKSRIQLEHADTASTYLYDEKDGFSYNVQYMRAGFSAAFRYNKDDKKIRLIRLSDWNAPSGMSGAREADLNLLTGKLKIETEYLDEKKETWVKEKPLVKTVHYSPIDFIHFHTDILERFRKEAAACTAG